MTTTTANSHVATIATDTSNMAKANFLKGPTELRQIAMGSPQVQWGINLKQQLVYLDYGNGQSSWKPVASLPSGKPPLKVDCGADGTVMALDTDHNVFRRINVNNNPGDPDSHWVQIMNGPDPMKWLDLSVGSAHKIVALWEKHPGKIAIYHYFDQGVTYPLSHWLQGNPVKVAVGDSGYLVYLDKSGELIHVRGMSTYSMGAWIKFKHVAVGQGGTVFGLDGTGNLYRYLGAQTWGQLDCGQSVLKPSKPGTPPEWETKPLQGQTIAVEAYSENQFMLLNKVVRKSGPHAKQTAYITYVSAAFNSTNDQ